MKKILTSLLLMFSLQVSAADNHAFEAVAQNIQTDNPAKIEVMEIFWYGCIHCYHMEKPLSGWVKSLPDDVYFKRIPGIPNPSWAPMAKAFYAMETLGVLEKLHHPIFDAVHKQKQLNPTDEKAIIDWIVKNGGLDTDKVKKAFKSFTLNTQLNKAAKLFRASGATGVPSLVIDGKYITSSTMAGGNQQALITADYIIDNVRKNKGGNAKK